MRPTGTETTALDNTQEPYPRDLSLSLRAQPHARASIIDTSNIPVICTYLKRTYTYVSISGHR